MKNVEAMRAIKNIQDRSEVESSEAVKLNIPFKPRSLFNEPNLIEARNGRTNMAMLLPQPRGVFYLLGILCRA